MLKRWIYFFLGALSLASVAVAGLEYLAKTQVDPIVEHDRMIQFRHLGLFLEDQEFLRRLEIFKIPKSPTHDAGEFLNPRISWAPNIEGTQMPQINLVPSELSAEVLRLKNDWMRHSTRLLKTRKPIDFSIFAQLAKFDYWDIEANSPIGQLIKTGRFVLPEAMPMPETIVLLTLSKLRLSRGVVMGAPLDALTDVRNLARLLLTTENIHLFSAGLAILDIERTGFRFYVERGMLDESAWHPISRNITRRASRALWATRGYFHIWTETETLKKVFLGPQPPVGLCAVINEGAPKTLSLKPLLESHFPLERDFRSPYVITDAITERAMAQCRLRYLKRMTELGRYETDFELPGFLTILPYSRKVFGLLLATLPFTGFEAYNALKQKQD